jgi:hypothetical protein
VVLAALGQREADVENDPAAGAFGDAEIRAVRRQAAKVWAQSLVAGAVLAGLVSLIVMLAR